MVKIKNNFDIIYKWLNLNNKLLIFLIKIRYKKIN